MKTTFVKAKTGVCIVILILHANMISVLRIDEVIVRMLILRILKLIVMTVNIIEVFSA